MPICCVGPLARRCDVRTKYVSHRAARAVLHLDLFEQPGKQRVFRQPARLRAERRFDGSAVRQFDCSWHRRTAELRNRRTTGPESPMLLMIDNYDSFTYNLVQYLRELGAAVVVHRNDRIGIEEIRALQPERIVLSPGPCSPAEAGSVATSSGHSAPVSPFSGSVSDTSASGRRTAAGSFAPIVSCTGRPRPFITTAAASSAGSPVLSRPRATIRCSSSARRSRVPGGVGPDRGGRDHGGATPVASGRGRAVSPRIHPHAVRQDIAGELPGRVRGKGGHPCSLSRFARSSTGRT